MKKWIFLLAFLGCFFAMPQKVLAAQANITADGIYEQFGFSKLQEELNQLSTEYQFPVKEMLNLVLSGQIGACFQMLLEELGNVFLGQFDSLKYLFAAILSLGIVSALLSNFANIFSKRQITEISFYFTYLILIQVLMTSFSHAAEIMQGAIDNIILFMKICLPTYFVVMGIGSGITTAAVYGNMILFLLFLLEKIIQIIALPAIYCYAFLNILNGLWVEEKLNGILELLKKGIHFLFKSILTLVAGIGMLQSMITPMIDTLKSAAVQKAVSVIPGIGNLTSGITEMVFGSAVLIKNSVGVLMMVGLLFLCVIPLVKLFMIAVIMKTGAAFIGIVSDKRISSCTDKLGDGSFMLLQACFTSLALFIIVIAIISLAANRGF